MTMTSWKPSPLKSSANTANDSLYWPGSWLLNRSLRRGCIFQSGASYQTSPTMMSGLPSLFTSATATPSERKTLSRTVFFQVIAVSSDGLTGSAVDTAASAASPNGTTAAIQQLRGFMSGPRNKAPRLQVTGGDYEACAGGLQPFRGRRAVGW